MRKDVQTGCVHVDMATDMANIDTTVVSRVKRRKPDTPLDDRERTKVRKINVQLQCLQSQLRPDLSEGVSCSKSVVSNAKIPDLAQANNLVRRAKAEEHFEIVFKPLDVCKGGCCL